MGRKSMKAVGETSRPRTSEAWKSMSLTVKNLRRAKLRVRVARDNAMIEGRSHSSAVANAEKSFIRKARSARRAHAHSSRPFGGG